MFPALVILLIVPCVAHFIVPFATRPLPSFPSPKEKGRRYIANPNNTSTTSTSVLYSPFSESTISFSHSEKRGL